MRRPTRGRFSRGLSWWEGGPATRADIETQGRFIDQVVQDEVEKPDGNCETRTVVRSISQPRIIAQLAAPTAADEDAYAALIRAELEELFLADQPMR